MSKTTSLRTAAIRDRLTAAFPENLPGYGYFTVKTIRRGKHQPRGIRVSWWTYPFENEVRAALGDLATDDVEFTRTQTWSCGRVHDDEMEAWQQHEGRDHLVYEDDCLGGDYVLPEDVEADLRAEGETFESECRPGNYIACPTCGGGARVLNLKHHGFEPCPTCAELGTDRQRFPGILDLDVPEHRAFYQAHLDTARQQARAAADREQAKREKALAEPTTHAAPTWLPLPTRAAGILNGIPVATRTGCDYLKHADDENRRVRCGDAARWFDPTTGLRVCTRHKTTPASPAAERDEGNA